MNRTFILMVGTLGRPRWESPACFGSSSYREGAYYHKVKCTLCLFESLPLGEGCQQPYIGITMLAAGLSPFVCSGYGLFQRTSKLIRAGGWFCFASYAFKTHYYIFGFHALYKRRNPLGVTVATSVKDHVFYNPIFNLDLYAARACAFAFMIDPHNYFYYDH